MSELRLERPTPEDIAYLVAHATDDDRREWGSTRFGGWSAAMAEATIAVLMEGVSHVFRESDGTPFCASGFHVSSPGVASSWTIRTAGWRKHLVSCVRVSRQVMAALLATDEIRRLEAWCPDWATKWPQTLGLEREAVLRRYAADGSDIVVWSKVKE